MDSPNKLEVPPNVLSSPAYATPDAGLMLHKRRAESCVPIASLRECNLSAILWHRTLMRT